MTNSTFLIITLSWLTVIIILSVKCIENYNTSMNLSNENLQLVGMEGKSGKLKEELQKMKLELIEAENRETKLNAVLIELLGAKDQCDKKLAKTRNVLYSVAKMDRENEKFEAIQKEVDEANLKINELTETILKRKVCPPDGEMERVNKELDAANYRVKKLTEIIVKQKLCLPEINKDTTNMDTSNSPDENNNGQPNSDGDIKTSPDVNNAQPISKEDNKFVSEEDIEVSVEDKDQTKSNEDRSADENTKDQSNTEKDGEPTSDVHKQQSKSVKYSNDLSGENKEDQSNRDNDIKKSDGNLSNENSNALANENTQDMPEDIEASQDVNRDQSKKEDTLTDKTKEDDTNKEVDDEASNKNNNENAKTSNTDEQGNITGDVEISPQEESKMEDAMSQRKEIEADNNDKEKKSDNPKIQIGNINADKYDRRIQSTNKFRDVKYVKH